MDYFVDHISTVPGIDGEEVELFVRERFQNERRDKPAVLMVQGATTATVPVFDLPFEDCSGMAFLAEAGFDVFAMDLMGYRESARPKMNDPCNTTEAGQRSLLIPNPLREVCKPSYPFRLTTIQSDWDDIDAVVDFIRDLRGSHNFFEDLGTTEKVSIKVACASHNLVWERQHRILLQASAECLRQVTYADQQTGSFFVDSDGQVHQE